MKTTIDLTEGVSPHEPFDLPDPSTMFHDGGDVVIQLREVGVRMTFPQFVAMTDAAAEWLFRGCRGEKDLNDPNTCPGFEHDRLRKVVRTMLVDGVLLKAEVSEELQCAIRSELKRIVLFYDDSNPFLDWKDTDEQLREAQATIAELREELKVARRRKTRQVTT